MTSDITPIPGHPGYGITEAGEVWTFKRSQPRTLTATRDTYGYLQVTLSQGKGRAYRVHRLMALTFLGPRPAGMEVRHLDGDRTNAALTNLAYGTRSENLYDAVRHGTHAQGSKTHCPRGHAYDETNTGRSRNGDQQPCRYCRTCKNEREREQRRRAAA